MESYGEYLWFHWNDKKSYFNVSETSVWHKRNKEYIRFLRYSKGSAGEVRSLLYAASDLKYISENQFNLLRKDSIDIISQLSNFIKYLKQNVSKP